MAEKITDESVVFNLSKSNETDKANANKIMEYELIMSIYLLLQSRRGRRI